MPPLSMSYRVPGVNILTPDATGPQYARWRRGLKRAFEGKGTWGYCDGSIPMPMPEAGPNFFSPVTKSNPQPQLLEERRAWTARDRDVKIDIFLSIADDIKLEVFENVNPPPKTNAMEMIKALDKRFQVFDFEEYHHAFCHFLNLHIDQFASLEDFNAEFAAILEDLLDHGYPMDNNQACSAYFSKLRCTQNPWVAKKLKEWNSYSTPPQLETLMKDCPPWMIIRPLATKHTADSQMSIPESIAEELMDTPSLKASDEDAGDSSDNNSEVATLASTPSSSPSHSRSSSKSQEITVHASVEDLRELPSGPVPPQQLPSKVPSAIPARLGSKNSMPALSAFPRLSSIPPPLNRPLPALPPEATAAGKARSRSRSASPKPDVPRLRTPVPPARAQPPQPLPPSQLSMELTESPKSIHPAPRPSSPTPQVSATSTPNLALPATPEIRRPSTSHAPPTLTPPSLKPEITIRPSSSRGLSKPPSHNPNPSTATYPPVVRNNSTTSSIISLPLQGATVPEYQDTIMGGNGSISSTAAVSTEQPKGLGLHIPVRQSNMSTVSTLIDPSRLSVSPPRNLISRFSAELNDDDKRSRKRSWNIKAQINSRRYKVKEMI